MWPEWLPVLKDKDSRKLARAYVALRVSSKLGVSGYPPALQKKEKLLLALLVTPFMTLYGISFILISSDMLIINNVPIVTLGILARGNFVQLRRFIQGLPAKMLMQLKNVGTKNNKKRRL